MPYITILHDYYYDKPNDALPILEQSLKEEECMAKWIMTNLPELLGKLWPYIESSAGNRPVNA